MAISVERRRFAQPAVAAAVVLLAAASAVTWWIARRFPVEEARRFLRAPIQVGEQPPAAPAAPAGPAAVEEHFATAQSRFAAGQYADAARDFAFVVTQDPGGPHAGPAQWNLTRSLLRSGEGQGAIAALDTLLRHYAGYLSEESPLLRQGLDEMERGELQAAQASLERMVEEQSDSEFVPLAHALLARIHWTHGEPMEMVRSFARMFASVRDRVPAYQVLATQLERYASGDQQVAETFSQLAREGPQGFRDIYQYLAARSLLEQDKFEATRQALEELRRRFPDGDFSHIVDLEHAWNFLRNGQAAEALAIFERLEQAPAPRAARAFDAFFDLRAELPLGIARCRLALGQYAEAVAAFDRAIAVNPHSVYIVENRLGMASAYEGLGQRDRAADVLRQLIAEHPDEPQLWAVRQQLQRLEGLLAAK